MTEAPCAGVLLTGGASHRLGVDKASVGWRGTTLARWAATELAAVCSAVIEVGDGASDLSAIREDPPHQGPLVAFLAGVDALGGESRYASVMLLACDYPLIDRTLLALVRDTIGATVIPVDGTKPQYGCAKYGHDTISAMKARAAGGERSFRWLRDFVELPHGAWSRVAPHNVFRDVDTPHDADALGIEI